MEEQGQRRDPGRGQRRGARALLVLLAPLVLAAPSPVFADDGEIVDVRFVGDADSPAARGAALGLDEATLAARYFGFRFDLHTDGDDAIPLMIAARPLAEVEALGAPGRVVMNAGTEERGACRPGLFHVAPSAAMIASAAEQWRVAHGSEVPRIEAWHPSLVKYAARDLNKRYRERFDEAMGSEAWAAWAAARSLGEAVLRTRSADPDAIAVYLEQELGLDGQKGVALSFRPNRQLRQPLYYVDAADEVVGEAPLVESRDLDTLGATECAP